MFAADFARTTPGGAPITAGSTVTFRKHSDNSVIGTALTDANGFFTFTADGHPGPYYWEVTSGGTTKRHSSKSTGYAGPFSVGELEAYFFGSFNDGVVTGLDSTLAVSADGGGMRVFVASGAATVKGILARYYTASTQFTIAASDPTNPRNDLVVIEVARRGASDEGRAVVTVLTGIPAAVPADPALTQTSTVWQFVLARVRVDAAVSVIAANKVTDLRIYEAPIISAGYVTGAMLANPLLSALGVRVDNTAAFLLEDAAGVDRFIINSTGVIGIVSGGNLILWADGAYADIKGVWNALTGDLSTRDGGDIAVYSDDAVTRQLHVDGATGDLTWRTDVVLKRHDVDVLRTDDAFLINRTADNAFLVEHAAGTDYLNVNTNIGRVDVVNAADLAVWAGNYTDMKAAIDGATGDISTRDGGDVTLHSDDGVTVQAKLDGAAGFVDLRENAAPATPAAGYARAYAKSDGRFYSKDDAGVETLMGSDHVAVTVADTASVDLTLTGQQVSAAAIFAGSGAAGTVARSDHAHATQIPISLWFQYTDLSGTMAVEARLPFWETGAAVGFSAVAGSSLVRMDRAGKVVGLALQADDNRTAGELLVKLKINGISTSFNGDAVKLDASISISDSSFLTPASGVAFAAGQTVGAELHATGLTPTLDALVRVDILLDAF